MCRVSFITASLIVANLLGACSGEQSQHSKQQSIIETIDFELITLELYASNLPAAWIGALMTGLVDPSEPETVYWDPGCSSFLIDAYHVVTAAHCVRGDQVFGANWRTKGSDPLEYKAVPFGDQVRLMFEGEMLDDAESSLSLEGTLKLIAIDRDVDFAVFESSRKLSDAEPKIAKESLKLGEQIALWSFPNGLPAMKSSRCEVLAIDEATGTIRHNCDSLTGSSGGMITNNKNEIAAVHIKGVIKNSYSYFKIHGRFEPVSNPDQGNRAIAFSKVLLSR